MSLNIETVNGQPYLPGAASLCEELDKKILVVLRDGRHLVGVLRSFDQFSNLVLEQTYERVIIPGNIKLQLVLSFKKLSFFLYFSFNFSFLGKYCDVPLGLYIVRGDNIVLVGDIDSVDESKEIANFKRITPEQLNDLNELTTAEEGKVHWDYDIDS